MLVSTEPGGLGNRIKSWVSALRLDPAARVYWPQTANMPAGFDDLFTNDCAVESIPPGTDEHCSWQLAVLPNDSAYLEPGFAEVVSAGAPVLRSLQRRLAPDKERYRFMVRPKRFSRRIAGLDGRVIDFEYSRIPDYFRQIYRPLFASIEVRPEICNLIDTWASANPCQGVIGLQLRTWRDSPNRHRKHYLPAVRRLRKLLQALPADVRIFVVSDHDDAVTWLQREIGAPRVLFYARETERGRSWESRFGMVEDLVDMMLLSRTESMFASYLSTFSETAWWLGGARAEVSVF